MHCHLSRLLLAFRPGELAGEDRAALDAHLRACPACAAAAKSDAAADSAIRSAMLAVPVPTGLRAKLLAAAAAQQGTAWRRKATGWAGGVLAASIAVSLISWGVWHYNRPVLTSDAMSVLLDQERLSREQTVGEWLRSKGAPATLPLPFEYGYYSSYGTQPLKGREVPVVEFQNGPHQCRVYVFRANAFHNPEGVWKDVTGSEFNIQAKVEGEWVYLIAYTSPTLEPFLKPLGPVA
jgi:hypothetical protein